MFGPVKIEEMTDPVEVERVLRQHEQAERNSDWLHSHWDELLPAALGKFVAVAGQEAFVADDSSAAYARAVAAHPDDKGVIVHYVRPEKGPRIYAHSRPLARVSRRGLPADRPGRG